jgi:hypothetical protein
MPHKKCFVVVDNSNVFIEGRKHSAREKGVHKMRSDELEPHDPSWGGVLTFQFNNTYFNWTQSFWNSWLDDTAGYQRSVSDAISAASISNPGVTNGVPLLIYGSQSLTWSN